MHNRAVLLLGDLPTWRWLSFLGFPLILPKRVPMVSAQKKQNTHTNVGRGGGGCGGCGGCDPREEWKEQAPFEEPPPDCTGGWKGLPPIPSCGWTKSRNCTSVQKPCTCNDSPVNTRKWFQPWYPQYCRFDLPPGCMAKAHQNL